MKTVVYVNELTFFRFLWLAWRRREPIVLSIEPWLSPLRSALERVVDVVVRRARLRRMLDLFPEFQHVLAQPATIYIYNIFEETEGWLKDRYGLHGADRPLPEYGMAIRQVTGKFTVPRYLPILLLKAALDRFGEDQLHVIGVPPDMSDQFAAYYGRALPSSVAPRARVPARFFNLMQFVAIVIGGAAWALSRIRPHVVTQSFFATFDYIEDPRDFRLYEELAEGGPLLLVVRQGPRGPADFPELARYAICTAKDGRFTVGGAFAAIGMVLCDVWALYRHHRHQPPALFYQIGLLPVRRAILRAFFSRFRPRYFWGRDDYNVEHILRRQEIHAIGGASLGVIHGTPGVAIVEPMWRYISFDRYFIFGRGVYDTHLKDGWAKDMKIVPIGTFGASRDDYRQIGNPRPPNIIIFTSVFADSEKLPAFVAQIAQAFPDRTIIMAPKITNTWDPIARRVLSKCVEAAPNVRTISPERDLFERMRMARYAFSDASTTVVEAIQFGLYSFFVDLSERQRVCYYRRFPALMLKNAEEAIQRVRAIECGTWSYPREDFSSLVALDGKVFFDAVREAMGLPPKERPIPIMKRLSRNCTPAASPSTEVSFR